MSQETLTALREMISTTWIGRHTCKDEDSYECIICETCIIFYQLGMEVLEYICPLPETSDLTKVIRCLFVSKIVFLPKWN